MADLRFFTWHQTRATEPESSRNAMRYLIMDHYDFGESSVWEYNRAKLIAAVPFFRNWIFIVRSWRERKALAIRKFERLSFMRAILFSKK